MYAETFRVGSCTFVLSAELSSDVVVYIPMLKSINIDRLFEIMARLITIQNT